MGVGVCTPLGGLGGGLADDSLLVGVILVKVECALLYEVGCLTNQVSGQQEPFLRVDQLPHTITDVKYRP